jgi:phospholipase D1/2
MEDNLTIEDSMMFSSTFSMLYGESATGYEYGLVINASQRILSLDSKNVFNMVQFVRFLSEALTISETTSAHRFASFAPLRIGCDAKYFVDGEGYFEHLYDCLLMAKKEIFITGWMLSPYFSLKRPDTNGEYRLDNVL